MVVAAQPARRRGRPRHAAQGRQRGRCRHRHANGAQSRRAAILRHRRRRLHPLLGQAEERAREHRRPRDCALGRYARALPRQRRQAAPPRRRHGERAVGRRCPACSPRSSSRTTNSASSHGPSCSSRPSSSPATGFAVSPRLAAVLAEVDPGKLRAGSARLFLRRGGEALARRPSSSTNAALADTLATIARDGPDAFYKGDIAGDIARAVQSDPRQPGTLCGRGYRELPRQGARSQCASSIAPSDLRCGAPSSGGDHGQPGAGPDRSLRSRPCAALRARPAFTSSSRPSGSLLPTVRAISPTATSSPSPIAGLLDPAYLAARRGFARSRPARKLTSLRARRPIRARAPSATMRRTKRTAPARSRSSTTTATPSP